MSQNFGFKKSCVDDFEKIIYYMLQYIIIYMFKIICYV